MKRAILTTFFLACTSNAISQPLELPRALSNGNVADADEVMANFNALKDGVNTRMSVDLTTYNTAIGNGLKNVTPGTPDASSGTLNTASGIGALSATPADISIRPWVLTASIQIVRGALTALLATAHST